MALALVRQLWDYHHWANRRLLDVAAELGDAVVAREVGKQFSAPTLKEMFATMLTMVDGSPPDTDINSYYRETGR